MIAMSFSGYIVKGYRFHTKGHSSNRAKDNSGVCIKGTYFGTEEEDFFGVLDEVLELHYPGPSIKRTVVFNCTWFETSGHGGSRVHRKLNIVEVKKSIKMHTTDTYVLAQQAVQVYYLPYPSYKRDLSDWLVVCKVKAREIFDGSIEGSDTPDEGAFQDDDVQPRQIDEGIDSLSALPLNDPDGTIFEEDVNIVDEADVQPHLSDDGEYEDDEEEEEDDDVEDDE